MGVSGVEKSHKHRIGVAARQCERVDARLAGDWLPDRAMLDREFSPLKNVHVMEAVPSVGSVPAASDVRRGVAGRCRRRRIVYDLPLSCKALQACA